jgi:uncharacterized protein YbaR (Trm112 family)
MHTKSAPAKHYTTIIAAGFCRGSLDEILVCPLTKGPLEYDRETSELISRKPGLAYPVRDGIPIMLPEEARKLE